MERITSKFLIAFGLALSLLFSVGCGFKLQGTAELAKELQTIDVIGVEEGTSIHRELHKSLRANDVTIDKNAETVLAITKHGTKREVVTYTGSGQGSQYDVTNNLTFELQTEEETTILGPYALKARRTYQVDQNNTTSSIAEYELLVRELQKELLNQMLRRLNVVSAGEFQEARADALEREKKKKEKDNILPL